MSADIHFNTTQLQYMPLFVNEHIFVFFFLYRYLYWLQPHFIISYICHTCHIYLPLLDWNDRSCVSWNVYPGNDNGPCFPYKLCLYSPSPYPLTFSYDWADDRGTVRSNSCYGIGAYVYGICVLLCIGPREGRNTCLSLIYGTDFDCDDVYASLVLDYSSG